MNSIAQRIADELGVQERQVSTTVALIDEGATIPFIARYRKEVTGGLDDNQLRTLDERLRYLRELDQRKAAILDSIREQGKLTDGLQRQIEDADTKARLEDIYLPFKTKRRTKAQIAREAGLEPLANALLGDPRLDPQAKAADFVDGTKGVADVAAALDGARAILVERFSEDAELIGGLREDLWSKGALISQVRDGKRDAGAKFSDYFDFKEPLKKLPSHRILALYRGEKEEILSLQLQPEEPPQDLKQPSSFERRIAHRMGVTNEGRPGDKWLNDTVRWA